MVLLGRLFFIAISWVTQGSATGSKLWKQAAIGLNLSDNCTPIREISIDTLCTQSWQVVFMAPAQQQSAAEPPPARQAEEGGGPCLFVAHP